MATEYSFPDSAAKAAGAERSAAAEFQTEKMSLSMGPSHPSTHGVLRLQMELDGEILTKVDPVLGYLHRGDEKIAENMTYNQFVPYTDRLDYLAPLANNMAYAIAVERLAKLGPRLTAIIDDSDAHGKPGAAEAQAAARLVASAGATNVKRQHMGKLQHNKTIVVNGPKVKAVLCGSTNFSWRALFVQSNSALIIRGAKAVAAFSTAFDNYWTHDTVSAFGATASAEWTTINPGNVSVQVAFSPHSGKNALLASVAKDVASASSSLFYSLAFLYQTPGAIRDAVTKVTNDDSVFVYGISDRKVGGGLDLLRPDGNRSPVYPASISGDLPEPFKSEPTGLAGGAGTRMHHKFVVIDFDKPTARVYLGSYNFSVPADTSNGENLLLIRNRRVAVSYMVEALRIFDHYHFRVLQQAAETKQKTLHLRRPPRAASEETWWKRDFVEPRRILDRELFS